MYEGDAVPLQPVLRCELCNKPFDKPSTLTRHGYYCRSRRAGGATNRVRSCTACAKGKARCDNTRPQCSRCMTKAIPCQYPESRARVTKLKSQTSDDASTEPPKMPMSLTADASSTEYYQAGSTSGDMSLDMALDMPDLDFANLGGEHLDWSHSNSYFDDFAAPETKGSLLPPQFFGNLETLTIPVMPNYSLRSLIERPRMKTGAQRTANLILHTLKSYPMMMLRDNTLPPFIHPGTIGSSIEDEQDMEAMNNCMNLVQMLGRGIKGSAKLFWRNVRMECERFCEEHSKFNKWELLAAMQALSIYMIIRLDEGETDHNNFDYLLLAAVKAIAKALTEVDVTFQSESALSNRTPEENWRDWIFEESRRRLCVIYKVVNLLVHFEPAAMCNLQTNLVIAPLPAKKQLWEASSELLWKMQSEKDLASIHKDTFGLDVNGELLRLDQDQLYCKAEMLHEKALDDRPPVRIIADWEEWCAGMDGFGGLVMLAASLLV